MAEMRLFPELPHGRKIKEVDYFRLQISGNHIYVRTSGGSFHLLHLDFLSQ